MTAREVWARQVAAVRAALAPWVVTVDGVEYVTPAAPPALRHLHGELATVGYAHGWEG